MSEDSVGVRPYPSYAGQHRIDDRLRMLGGQRRYAYSA